MLDYQDFCGYVICNPILGYIRINGGLLIMLETKKADYIM